MNYTYETKCRKCGGRNQWYFGDADKIKWQDFALAMDDHVAHPRQNKCSTCEQETVQDVIAYTPYNNS